MRIRTLDAAKKATPRQSRMTKPIIVLTNDDGYFAPGISAAYHAVRDLGRVVVVAPRSERSACSHTITLRRPISVERFTHDEFGPMFIVEGTPADCVRLAYAELIEGDIGLVVSGINAGANSGVDVFYSGTIAGAREAAILRIPAIALSQSLRAGVELDWQATRKAARVVVDHLLQKKLPGPGFWSVNLPAPIPEDPQNHIHRVPVATHSMPMKFERAEHEGGRLMEFAYGASYWLREETAPSDYAVIRDGGIAISAIPLAAAFPND